MKFKFLEAKYVTNDIDVAYFGQSAENALISSCLHILDSMANLISCSLRPNKPSFQVKKCHRGQILISAYSYTLLVNDLGLAQSVTVARLSL